LEQRTEPIIEVRRHDIASESVGTESFDLVHARFVLTHVPRWRDALRYMVEAVRPGGWLCLEEPDFLVAGLSDPPTPGLERFWAAVAELQAARGGDPSVGRKLGAAVHELGLSDIDGEGRVVVHRDVLAVQVDMLGAVLCGSRLMSPDDLALARKELGAPGFSYSPIFVAVRARRVGPA
jgi:hypothetical protein